MKKVLERSCSEKSYYNSAWQVGNSRNRLYICEMIFFRTRRFVCLYEVDWLTSVVALLELLLQESYMCDTVLEYMIASLSCC